MKKTAETFYFQCLFSFFLSLCITSLYAQKRGDQLLYMPRTIKIAPFQTLKVYSGIVLNLIPSDENKIVIYGDPYSGVVSKHSGTTLKLKIRLRELVPYHQPFIDLYYTEQLNALRLHQGAVVEALRPLEAEKLTIAAHEGSTFSGEINASHLLTKVHTGSDVTLYGRVKTHYLNVNTGGLCKAEELLTERSWVKAFAGGNGSVYSDDTVHAKVLFGGTISLYGKPEQLIASRYFGGYISDENGLRLKENKRRSSRSFR